MNNKEYKKLQERNYTKYSVCQLEGCDKPLVRKFHQKIRKYCCEEHALEAQRAYRKEWNKRNKDNIKVWNRRYFANRKKRIAEGVTNEDKNNE